MNKEKSPMERFVSEIIVNQAKNTMINSIRNTDDIEWLKQEFEKTLREKWEKDKRYMKGYHPQRCSSDFCPYYDSCDNAGTIVDTLAMERRVYVEEEIYHPESEATGTFI